MSKRYDCKLLKSFFALIFCSEDIPRQEIAAYNQQSRIPYQREQASLGHLLGISKYRLRFFLRVPGKPFGARFRLKLRFFFFAKAEQRLEEEQKEERELLGKERKFVRKKLEHNRLAGVLEEDSEEEEGEKMGLSTREMRFKKENTLAREQIERKEAEARRIQEDKDEQDRIQREIEMLRISSPEEETNAAGKLPKRARALWSPDRILRRDELFDLFMKYRYLLCYSLSPAF